jgi:hypothetical protein
MAGIEVNLGSLSIVAGRNIALTEAEAFCLLAMMLLLSVSLAPEQSGAAAANCFAAIIADDMMAN